MSKENNLVRLFSDRLDDSVKLICYFPVGDPAFDTTHLADVYLASGVDVLEMGIAVPNPYLDGAIVKGSMERTRKACDTQECFGLIRKIRAEHPEAALEVFCYKQLLDLLPVKEVAAFLDDARVDSILMADATPDECATLREDLPDFVSILGFLPFSASPEEAVRIASIVDGYVFLQAIDGVTGGRAKLSPSLPERVASAKTVFGSTAVCPGFGISTPGHCAQVKSMGADGLIIGSEVIRHALEGEAKLVSFLTSCKGALKK